MITKKSFEKVTAIKLWFKFYIKFWPVTQSSATRWCQNNQKPVFWISLVLSFWLIYKTMLYSYIKFWLLRLPATPGGGLSKFQPQNRLLWAGFTLKLIKIRFFLYFEFSKFLISQGLFLTWRPIKSLGISGFFNNN